MCEAKRTVTIIYCCEGELELFRDTRHFSLNVYGDMIIPDKYKRGKTIVAICEGEIKVLNSVGDRLISQH